MPVPGPLIVASVICAPLAGRWRAAGADVRLPHDTEWGQHEGVLIDPDGNVIRFGSPMP
jgi:hypothetical protein